MTKSVLGLSWPVWLRAAAANWLLLLAAVWVDWLYAWPEPESPAVLPATGIVFACTLLVTALPGAAALLGCGMKAWPPRAPEAAALSCLTLAILLGSAWGATSGLAMGMETGSLASAVVIGVAAFPLTFGVAFPLAIPLACSCAVWWLAKRHDEIPRRTWMWLTGIAAVGWALVVCSGIVLGTM